MRRLEEILARIEAFVAISALVAMVLLSFLQILARNFFDTGLPGTDVLLRYLVLVVTFMGAVLAVRDGRHIRLDVLSGVLNDRWRRRIQFLFVLVSALVCGLFSWAAVRYWREEWRFAGVGGGWTAALSLILPIGFGLLTLHFLLQAWIEARGAEPPA